MNSASINCMNSTAITPPAGHYSHVCVATGQVFISGQLPITPDGTPLTGRSFEEQTDQVLANVEGCLAQAGVDKNSLVQVTHRTGNSVALRVCSRTVHPSEPQFKTARGTSR